MLDRFDRIQVTTHDREALAAAWTRLLDAQEDGKDASPALGARRTSLRLGQSVVELLEPDGVGRVADHLAASGGGLLAAGFSTPDPERLADRLRRAGVSFEQEAGRLLATGDALGLPGLDVVVTRSETRPSVGLLRGFYEATHLTSDAGRDIKRIAEVFGLDADHFVPIRSEEYGYDGALTLFHPDRLDRVETITPYDVTKTMGRYFAKRGPCLYMCYAECDDTAAVRARLLDLAPKHWTGPRDGDGPDNLFIHPAALGGLMVGVSRTTHAWTWSGSPDRVRR